MASSRTIPDFVWKIMKPLNQYLASRASQKRMSHMVLLLMTTGRKSGMERVTPLQYEELDGAYYIGSARGAEADWYRNLVAQPNVEIEVCGERRPALAETVSDPKRVADFLELRLERRPKFIGRMMRLEGLPPGFTRQDLEEFAAGKAMVILHPQKN